MTSPLLWIHAIAGAAWVGASACFVIAGIGLVPGSGEALNFAVRGAPKINGFAMGAAIVLVLSGIANLFVIIKDRRGALPAEFVMVLGIKVVLFFAMLAAIGSAIRAGAAARGEIERGNVNAVPPAIRSMTIAHGTVMAMGAVALILGLWLTGS
ncbi:MAG TPA: hypothetical protein VMU16_08455 [Candidatus Binataceae bacterium]|nr:hypothetical protein [Candidatus Binataceae bacterium]